MPIFADVIIDEYVTVLAFPKWKPEKKRLQTSKQFRNYTGCHSILRFV